jgi:hypothetical protein
MILRNKTRFDWLLAICMFFLSGAALAATPVGEVSLVIGAARVVGETGNSAAVQRGLPVFPGDRIETEEGGHVHLRFVDGAFVSVRPGSRLRIETYRYDVANPQDSAIRFQLEQGVARSITGKGGEAARERFRLNTPIAAIGVKGTDFVVQASGDNVRVAVHSGAIVMAPIGEGCASDAFGPCQTDAARTLSADMGRVMLEFNRQQGTPRVVPVGGQLPVERAAPPPAEEPRTAGVRRNEANVETLAVRTVNAGRDNVPAQPPVQPPLPPSALVWGHWPWSTALSGDTLSVPYAEGRQNGDRQMVAGNDYYLLFRNTADASGTLPTNLGRVDFSLRDSQVHFLANGGDASLASSRNGWLKVDFGARSFETGMTLSHDLAGSTQLSAAGAIDRRGKFSYIAADTKLAGALTIDGQEAGYTFVRDVTNGKFVGIARWVR